jgi:hypothetical protein
MFLSPHPLRGLILLDTSPKEAEWRSWLYAAIWSLVIFCSIPFARAFIEIIEDYLSLDFFLYATLAGTVAGGALAVSNLRRRTLPLGAYWWLLGTFTAFIGYTYYLRDIPVEAVHVLEYGILGLLVYRALVHRVQDYSVYVMATLIVGLVGVIDEYFQWLIPGRVFDLRDIRTNLLAGGLAQIGLAAGLRPSLVSGLPSRKNQGRLCYFVAAGLILLAIGFMNTPERVAWYAKRIPALSFLLDSNSMMVEYGYRYFDPEVGVFRSRFSHEQLKENDSLRGAEVAHILDRYIGGEGYGPFQKTFSVPRDAYTHEVGVHLFRRKSNFARARLQEEGGAEPYNIAFRENQILEKYYPTALQNSKHWWTSEIRTEVISKASQKSGYESRVSAGLITRVSKRQVLLGFILGTVVCLVLGAYLKRE